MKSQCCGNSPGTNTLCNVCRTCHMYDQILWCHVGLASTTLHCGTLARLITCRYHLRPRFLRDVSHIVTATCILGQEVSFPVCVSPTAMQCMAHYQGELATARGTLVWLHGRRRHVGMCVTSTAPCTPTPCLCRHTSLLFWLSKQ